MVIDERIKSRRWWIIFGEVFWKYYCRSRDWVFRKGNMVWSGRFEDW